MAQELRYLVFSSVVIALNVGGIFLVASIGHVLRASALATVVTASLLLLSANVVIALLFREFSSGRPKARFMPFLLQSAFSAVAIWGMVVAWQARKYDEAAIAACGLAYSVIMPMASPSADAAARRARIVRDPQTPAEREAARQLTRPAPLLGLAFIASATAAIMMLPHYGPRAIAAATMVWLALALAARRWESLVLGEASTILHFHSDQP